MALLRLPAPVRGILSAALAANDTTLTSAQLASLPAVASPDTLVVTLSYGTQTDEDVTITAHTAGATTATINAVVGAWPTGTRWDHTPTAADRADFSKIGPFTTSATPGTRTNHAHSLGAAPSEVIIVVTGTDNDTDNAFSVVQYVKADATNITVKSHVASVTFIAYVKA